MISKYATKFALVLLKHEYVSTNDLEVVSYGLFSIISKFTYFMICLAAGSVFKCAIESAVFYFSVIYLKKYAGGFHAKTEAACFIISSVSIITSVIVISMASEVFVLGNSIYWIAIFSTIVIVTHAPVASVEKPLNHKERKKYSKVEKMRVLFAVFIIAFFYHVGLKEIALAICLSLVLVSVFLLLGIKKLNVHTV